MFKYIIIVLLWCRMVLCFYIFTHNRIVLIWCGMVVSFYMLISGVIIVLCLLYFKKYYSSFALVLYGTLPVINVNVLV